MRRLLTKAQLRCAPGNGWLAQRWRNGRGQGSCGLVSEIVMEIPFSTQILLYSHWEALLLGETSRAGVCGEHWDMSLLKGIPKKLIHCARTAEEPRRVAWSAILQKELAAVCSGSGLGRAEAQRGSRLQAHRLLQRQPCCADSHPGLASV